jgi:hypothetical protein
MDRLVNPDPDVYDDDSISNLLAAFLQGLERVPSKGILDHVDDIYSDLGHTTEFNKIVSISAASGILQESPIAPKLPSLLATTPIEGTIRTDGT